MAQELTEPLDAQPALTAMAILEWLREIDPDRFHLGHVRTVQRFVRVHRAAMAREVLLGMLPPVITAEPPAQAA